jgi:hypothetical protein
MAVWILPVAAAVVGLIFAATLLRRPDDRRRPHRVLWAVAMIMYSIASATVALGAAGGWSRGEFLVYWALGAVLNVPFLAAGEVVLVFRRSVALSMSVLVLLALSIATVAAMADAVVDVAALARELPSGKLVFGDDSLAFRLPQLISIPSYLVLVVGALWSAWTMRGRPELRDRFVGTLLVVVGATVTAVAGSAFAATGNLPAFSVALLTGIVVMFWGFVRASRTPALAPRSQG